MVLSSFTYLLVAWCHEQFVVEQQVFPDALARYRRLSTRSGHTRNWSFAGVECGGQFTHTALAGRVATL